MISMVSGAWCVALRFKMDDNKCTFIDNGVV